MGERLKNFLSDIKFYFERIFSNPQKIKGKCKNCGECCKTIVFYVGENPISNEEQFELLKKWDKKYNNFVINGKAADGALYFKCRALKDNNKCGMYFLRSLACRMYPKYKTSFFTRGEGLKPSCGYYIDVKSFKDFLK